MKLEYGMRNKNADGWYKVIADPETHRGGKVLAKFDNGQTKLLNYNEELENLKAKPFEVADEGEYWIAIGFLAKNCFILVQENEGGDKFPKIYEKITKKTLKSEHYVTYGVWGIEFRINFHKEIFKHLFNLKFEEKMLAKNNDDVCQVNKNKWGYELLALGFDMGGEQDANKIRQNVPSYYQENFDLGYSVACGLNLKKITKSLVGGRAVYQKNLAA